MSRLSRLRSLPLRSKLILTLVGGAAVVLGAATHFSFRYWERESLDAARVQALLAARSSRSTVETGYRVGSVASIDRHLIELRGQPSTVAARIYDRDGHVVHSAEPSEVGRRDAPVWIPEAASLPRDGVVHTDEGGETVRVFMPLAVSGAAILEIATSVAPLRTAMRRGARLGLGLAVGSVVALALIIGAMLQAEVMTPLHRVEGALADAGNGESGGGGRAKDEVRFIEASLGQLIERQKEAEARAAEREGFAEVGQMAAEMAHEFKRPLAAIRMALDVFQQEYRLDPHGRDTMASVNQQLGRLTETMQDLFNLAKPAVVEGEKVSIPDLVDDALLEFAGQPGAGRVRPIRRYEPGVPPVLGDPLRLRQAFANLMVNALEAMPDGGDMTLTVAAREPGWVVVTIADTGAGFASGDIDRAFLPFYSTKPQGTGLGLPLVARVVVAHEGRICADSTPGEGTSIALWLPAADADRALLTESPCPASAFSSSMTTA